MIINVIMKFGDFVKRMLKPVFTFAEAQMVAHEEPAAGLRLNLHRWAKKGTLIRLRREVYMFGDRASPLPLLISALYPPAYVSLETALNQHGLLPDVPFETTLVTPRATRSFQTPLGRFHFHRIHPRLFFGFDPSTLLADPEKALLDYFYFRRARLVADPVFWRESRLQNFKRLDWGKGGKELEIYRSDKMSRLWESLKRYAKTQRAD